MDRSERFYKIDQMLRERRMVPLGDFLDALGVSRATFKRDLEYLRDRYNAPIEWDREAGGYRLAKEAAAGPGYELPGLWFNAGEIHALLTMQHLLKGLEPGLLTPHPHHPYRRASHQTGILRTGGDGGPEAPAVAGDLLGAFQR